jgi:hypothetical protein
LYIFWFYFKWKHRMHCMVGIFWSCPRELVLFASHKVEKYHLPFYEINKFYCEVPTYVLTKCLNNHQCERDLRSVKRSLYFIIHLIHSQTNFNLNYRINYLLYLPSLFKIRVYIILIWSSYHILYRHNKHLEIKISSCHIQYTILF